MTRVKDAFLPGVEQRDLAAVMQLPLQQRG